MKRLKINGLEINRFNDKSVRKWNREYILLTNKNPLIPVTIPTFNWNVTDLLLTKAELESLALVIPERFLNYIEVSYSDNDNVKIAHIEAKEGYVITKGQTEYRKVYNLCNIHDHISLTNSSRIITTKQLVNMFPSMLGTDGYLTYNPDAVNYLNNLKTSGGQLTVHKGLTKWNDDALSGLSAAYLMVDLLDDNSWAAPNKGMHVSSQSYFVSLHNYTRILNIPYIGVNYIQLSVSGSTAYNNPTAVIPTIYRTTIDPSIINLTITIPSSAFTKDMYYSTQYYNTVKNRITPGPGQTVTLKFIDGSVVI